jgi:hypothetical protein
MDPLSLCVALGPVAVYLLLLGLINLSTRPFLTTGLRDGAALAIAISGLAMVGPLRLLVPDAAVYRFGGFVWLMLLALYALGATLTLLLMRPRLVVYNMTIDQLRPVLASVVERVGDQPRWAGDSLLLPNLGVHLHVESFPALRNLQLLPTGPNQDFAGWRRLELEIKRQLKDVAVPSSPRSGSLIGMSFALVLVIVISLVTGYQTVTQELTELFQIR